MQQKIITVLIVILVLGIGILVGTKISKKSVQSNVQGNVENTYQSGWAAAMKTISDAGIFSQSGIEIKNISGTVQSIAGNKLTIKVSTPGLIDTPELVTRTVTINANTKIVKLVSRDATQVQKEMEEFVAKMKDQTSVDPKNVPTPPQSFDKKDVTAGDIKVGQNISIQATEDIKNKQQFAASEIQVQ